MCCDRISVFLTGKVVKRIQLKNIFDGGHLPITWHYSFPVWTICRAFLESPSTSDYDLTYSTLLNGGRIDESCLPGINQSTCLSKRRRLRRHPVWRFFKDVDGTKVGIVFVI